MTLSDSNPSLKTSIKHYPDAFLLDDYHKLFLMDEMNDIISENWDMKEPHWTAARTPFTSSHGLLLVEQEDILIGFSVYLTFKLLNSTCIYRSGTELRPAVQSSGLYGRINRIILKQSFANGKDDKGPENIFYSWRTRNAIVTHTQAKLCTDLIPFRPGGNQQASAQLESAAVEAARLLYPLTDLEMPRCLMRGVYSHIQQRRPNYIGAVEQIAEQIEYIAPNPQDAIFFMGVVNRQTML